MIRNLLASTAIATLLTTGAYAQATEPAPDAGMEQAQPNVIHAEGLLAANVIGETVYNSTADDAENIGSVNDIIITEDGSAEAVVIGVGGFLGLGQKDVGIAFDAMQWHERDGERVLVLETTAEQLEELPEFDRSAFEPQPADAEIGNTQWATAEDLGITPVATDTDDDALDTDDDEAADAPTDEPPTDDLADDDLDDAEDLSDDGATDMLANEPDEAADDGAEVDDATDDDATADDPLEDDATTGDDAGTDDAMDDDAATDDDAANDDTTIEEDTND